MLEEDFKKFQTVTEEATNEQEHYGASLNSRADDPYYGSNTIETKDKDFYEKSEIRNFDPQVIPTIQEVI